MLVSLTHSAVLHGQNANNMGQALVLILVEIQKSLRRGPGPQRASSPGGDKMSADVTNRPSQDVFCASLKERA